MILAVTGHRPASLNNEYNYDGPNSQYVIREMKKVIEHLKPSHLISGMALGVDTMFAIVGLGYGLPIWAYVPFVGQESKWPFESRMLYQVLLSNPLVKTRIVCEGGYSPKAMQVRNEAMVNDCDHLLAVWNGGPGGTANCVEYAIKVNRAMTRINPHDRIKP